MRGAGDVEPDTTSDKTLLRAYDWPYHRLRIIVDGRPLGMSGK